MFSYDQINRMILHNTMRKLCCDVDMGCIYLINFRIDTNNCKSLDIESYVFQSHVGILYTCNIRKIRKIFPPIHNICCMHAIHSFNYDLNLKRCKVCILECELTEINQHLDIYSSIHRAMTYTGRVRNQF